MAPDRERRLPARRLADKYPVDDATQLLAVECDHLKASGLFSPDRPKRGGDGYPLASRDVDPRLERLVALFVEPHRVAPRSDAERLEQRIVAAALPVDGH